ncbi:hypothetical protein [Pontixanthobacter aquaemixtae]|uniref:Uncharacterized protein n=1 Tax=Pontixanthobacter aquaemixtae TaxID=1958940 RepID=A0A844ZNL3_9SPHN|nr:hypothetical protein [Pontixanthobacter aquaemixtae]MXO89348.1 hypothetical protein [Pontixanthobacter aquaemixtae]
MKIEKWGISAGYSGFFCSERGNFPRHSAAMRQKFAGITAPIIAFLVGIERKDSRFGANLWLILHLSRVWPPA